MRERDVVALSVDLSDLGLARGEMGTIVHVLGDGEAFIVEFVAPDGRTLGLPTLRPDQIQMPPMPEEIVPIVDERLFDSDPLTAVRKIREFTGLGIRQACDLMYARYDHLRETSPQRFNMTPEEYWSGWYS